MAWPWVLQLLPLAQYATEDANIGGQSSQHRLEFRRLYETGRLDSIMGQRAYTQLHFTAQTGDLTAVTDLIAKRKNPNHFDEGGCTPLHYAAAGNHFDVVKALLAAGANVDAHDDGVAGDTPLSTLLRSAPWKCAAFGKCRCRSDDSWVDAIDSVA